MKFIAERKIFIIFTLFVCFAYIFFGMLSSTLKGAPLQLNPGFITESSQYNYFRYLAKSFLNGRLDVTECPAIHDLVLFNQKKYLYWPPVPALVFMPLVAAFGLDLPDRLLNILMGAANIYLFLLVIRRICQRYNYAIDTISVLIFGAFWAFGTVHFYMSLSGGVWFISQVLAQTFLLGAVYCLMAENKKIRKYLLSGFWFALAVYTRNDIVFGGIFFLIIILEDSGYSLKGLFLKRGLLFGSFFIIFSLINLYYNYARFGNAFDNGINYHNMGADFLDKFRNWGYMSMHYIPYNFYVEIVRLPKFINRIPLIEMDFNGFGFIWASPFFLMIIPAGMFYLKSFAGKQKYISAVESKMVLAALISVLLIGLIILMIMGTGVSQFAARYTLDFHLFLCLILLPFINYMLPFKWFKVISLALIFVSFCMNTLGVFLFY